MTESEYINLLEHHGIRPTSNRLLVVRALDREEHPSTMAQLEQALVTLDKSSIFRCLVLFRENHLVHVLDDGEGGVRYELCRSPHHDDDDDRHAHFYCEQCHQLYCLHDVPVPQVAVPEGYVVHTASHIVKGICADCMRRRGEGRA